MKRAYGIILERGENSDGREYVVVAASAEQAMRKAKKRAQDESCVKTDWRVINLFERKEPVVL